MEDEKVHKVMGPHITNKEENELWFSSIAADESHSFDADRAFDKFRQRTLMKRSSHFRLSAIWYRVAVVALVLAACGISYWQGGSRIQNKFTDIVVEAPLGSKSKLLLPDGSLVWLNAGSRITYSQGFGVNDRHLHLNGEAYFEVTKNESLPFDVQTRELGVMVLGTKFNFRNYEDDEEVTVNLLEGKVRLANNLKKQDVSYLSPSEKVTLNKRTGKMTIARAKSASAKEWTNNGLFFDEMPLVDIVKELNRSYNVKIRIVDDQLSHCRFYASFDRRKQDIQDVLDILTATNLLRYKMEGDSILLYDY